MKKSLVFTATATMFIATVIAAWADGHGRPPEQNPNDPASIEFGEGHPLLKGQVDHDASGAASRSRLPHLTYYGGPVLSHATFLKILYGAGTYQTFVTDTTASSIQGFLQGIVGSAYFSWLTEYNTTSPVQTIGLGTYGGAFAITPSAANNGATITDTQIMAEVSAQISAGVLPAPGANTVYSLFFPKGKTISQGGSKSCVSGGFCAYHGTFKRNAINVYYDVMPDQSAGSGCDSGCGSSPSPFANQTSVFSHEMIETVTDPAVGIATTLKSPLAWYDSRNGEIGDICNGQQGTVTGTNGTVYTVQKEWSNASGICKVQ